MRQAGRAAPPFEEISEPQLCDGGAGGGDFVPAEGDEEFVDQGSTEAMGELATLFFMVARMRVRRGVGERGLPSRRAFRRPPLRSRLLQARRDGSVRLGSQRDTLFPGRCVHG